MSLTTQPRLRLGLRSVLANVRDAAEAGFYSPQEPNKAYEKYAVGWTSKMSEPLEDRCTLYASSEARSDTTFQAQIGGAATGSQEVASNGTNVVRPLDTLVSVSTGKPMPSLQEVLQGQYGAEMQSLYQELQTSRRITSVKPFYLRRSPIVQPRLEELSGEDADRMCVALALGAGSMPYESSPERWVSFAPSGSVTDAILSGDAKQVQTVLKRLESENFPRPEALCMQYGDVQLTQEICLQKLKSLSIDTNPYAPLQYPFVQSQPRSDGTRQPHLRVVIPDYYLICPLTDQGEPDFTQPQVSTGQLQIDMELADEPGDDNVQGTSASRSTGAPPIMRTGHWFDG